MKIGLSALLALVVISSAFASDELIEKTVYNAKCESKKVMLKENEHGVYEADNTIPTWLENGYMVDFHQVQVRKCDPRFDAPCTNCKQ